VYVIGLTGGIGSGKSTVAAMLAEKGATVLNADQVGWDVYRPGGPAYEPIIEAFGREIVADDGSVNRKKLGAIVFADPEARQRLNAITHPLIKEGMQQRLMELAETGDQVVVMEAAILLEAGWDDLVDAVWVTVAQPEVVVGRLDRNKGLSREEALARISAQLSNEERMRRAGVVIDTDCSLAQTRRLVEEKWDEMRSRRRSPSPGCAR
jgi:dephospho-CoA kinase